MHTNTSSATTDRPTLAVAGAGIIGLCCALALQRAGHAVTVYDPLPPGSATSYGNAGLLSVDSCVPMALPGMLRQVPRWLTDPSGPLALRPSYALRALPWLLRWVQAGRMPQVRRSAAGLNALHSTAVAEYRALLGAADFDALVRSHGQLHVWQGTAEGRSDQIARELRDHFGIPTEALSAGQLQDLVPQLSPRIQRGLMYPRGAHTLNPQGIVQALARLLIEAGGRIRHEKVFKLLPESPTRCRVLSSVGDRHFDRVVVACGAWSRELLAPLGVKVPLDTERGYHVWLRKPSFTLPVPVMHKDLGFAATPMADGLRIAGTVEIGGLALPPDERRAENLRRHAMDLFPSLRFERADSWMGFRPSMPDSLPVIDRLAQHPGVFAAFGHGHFGLVGGAMTGRILSALVQGVTPPVDAAPYRITRF